MSTTKARILLVEDEPAIQQVIGFILKRNGYEVYGVFDGAAAIEAVGTFNPHLIILDLVMRPVSGWEVLQWLKERQMTLQIPVLVMSALVNLREQVQGLEGGAVEYLTKPAQPSQIIERVKTLLSLTPDQRLMLQHKRMDERRKILERLNERQDD